MHTLKILILGSEGFVGTNLVRNLNKIHQVLPADQIKNSKTENYVQFDITNYESVEQVVKNVDVVINLAAHTLIASIGDEIKNAQTNIIGLLNVLEACRKNNISKIIFTSASSIIGQPNQFQVSENHVVVPKTAYGITKMTSEHYIRLYKEMYGINYVIFRFFNIYGPYQKNGLIPSLYSHIIRNEPIAVFGKGDQIRDYVYVEDIVSFFEKAVSTNIADNNIFNLGTGKGSTVLDIIKTLSKILNIEPKIEFKPQRPGEIGNFVADTTFLKSKFGFIPQTRVEEGLEKTIEWLKTSSASHA